jgi:hypothetical protein
MKWCNEVAASSWAGVRHNIGLYREWTIVTCELVISLWTDYMCQMLYWLTVENLEVTESFREHVSFHKVQTYHRKDIILVTKCALCTFHYESGKRFFRGRDRVTIFDRRHGTTLVVIQLRKRTFLFNAFRVKSDPTPPLGGKESAHVEISCSLLQCRTDANTCESMVSYR